MRRAYVDTGAFFAGLSRADEHHERFAAHFTTAAREGWRLVTTTLVVAETHALLIARGPDGRRTALAYLEQVPAGAVQLVRVTAEDERRALAIIRAHDDQDYTLCDATSFVVMERLRVVDVLTTDDHFRAYGRFVVL